MSIVQASDTPWTEAPSAGRARRRLPVWLRLVMAMSAMLLVTWSMMIYLTYAQQRDASIAQSRSFAQSVYQMTVAAITALMITDVADQRGIFLEQVRNSNDVNDIRVLRYGTVIAQYGDGDKTTLTDYTKA